MRLISGRRTCPSSRASNASQRILAAATYCSGSGCTAPANAARAPLLTDRKAASNGLAGVVPNVIPAIRSNAGLER